MNMLQISFANFDIVVWPNWSKEGMVQCLTKNQPTEFYTIPEFIEILDRVHQFKIAARTKGGNK